MPVILGAIPAMALIMLSPSAASITAAELVLELDMLQGTRITSDNPKLAGLLTHMRLAFDAYGASLKESRTNGIPRSCPPTEMKLTLDDLVTSIKNAPAAIQKSELSVAIGYIMDHRYPCGPANPKTTPST